MPRWRSATGSGGDRCRTEEISNAGAQFGQRLQNAKARGSATVAIEQALNDVAKLLQWIPFPRDRGGTTPASMRAVNDAGGVPPWIPLLPASIPSTLVDEPQASMRGARPIGTTSLCHRDEAHPDSANHPIGQGFSVKGDAAKRHRQQPTGDEHLGFIAMLARAALTRGERTT